MKRALLFFFLLMPITFPADLKTAPDVKAVEQEQKPPPHLETEAKPTGSEKLKEVPDKTKKKIELINKKLDSIVFDLVDLENVTPFTAVDYFHSKSFGFDPVKTGINIMLLNDFSKPGTVTPVITIREKNISVGSLLKKLCDQASLNMKIEPYSVVIGRNIPVYDMAMSPLSKGKCSKIIIDEINLRGAKIKDIVVHLTERSIEHDEDEENKGLNVFVDEKIEVPGVSLTLDDIPIGEVIRYICILLDLKYEVKENTVILYKDKKTQP
ncbi:MAG TPA: hypothetical protein DCZ94_16725 [Lentisphaeria bacterium]|nr:MAG: hypothetical protein A2X48_16805 [Lentisphaerae bacterium GWF2_49_21]HBC88593.1 hypothetical protein [Lentisphaeria bacterium]